MVVVVFVVVGCEEVLEERSDWRRGRRRRGSGVEVRVVWEKGSWWWWVWEKKWHR